jgi:Cu/Ag efflux protein CusF
MKYILSIITTLLVSMSIAAPTNATLKDGKIVKVKATVKKIYRDDKKITLDHEEIKGYMKAMTMTFAVEDAKIFDKVSEGTKGLFTMKIVKGFPVITGVKVASSNAAIYVCPMHADQRSDKPGSCKKCGMDLVKQK